CGLRGVAGVGSCASLLAGPSAWFGLSAPSPGGGGGLGGGRGGALGGARGRASFVGSASPRCSGRLGASLVVLRSGAGVLRVASPRGSACRRSRFVGARRVAVRRVDLRGARRVVVRRGSCAGIRGG